MTTFTAFIDDRGYNGFSVSGHSVYGEEGGDIVCAAVSSAVSLALSLLERTGCEFSLDVSDDNAHVGLELFPNEKGDLVIDALREHFEGIAQEYGKFLSVAVKRRRTQS